ncbi:helix-turn-helix domain-containing protein [Streptomyces sp. NPDC086554]|uniref:helix-turn-helix domain-containing protein n=1 Tax=Streptomyces sp. NPDC086554 TaxID=3154864 RepID=UPI00343871AB
MSRWKELPDSLDPRVRQFVVRLRRLKDHSGLGLAALASRTGYSRSSWDRYLNGRSLPPAEAVEALARACDSEPAPLLALREVAAEGWESDADTGAAVGETAPAASGAAVARRPVPWLAIVLSSVCTALLMLAVFALLAPWEKESEDKGDDRPFTGEAHPEFGEFEYKPGKTYECEVRRDDDGRLYAGYSRTRTELIERLSTRWSVVEAQCLLEHREASPGVADGAFGNNTERAVKRIQDKANIAVDGKIGPDTWKVLRK